MCERERERERKKERETYANASENVSRRQGQSQHQDFEDADDTVMRQNYHCQDYEDKNRSALSKVLDLLCDIPHL
jgi:hypothetical protein